MIGITEPITVVIPFNKTEFQCILKLVTVYTVLEADWSDRFRRYGSRGY